MKAIGSDVRDCEKVQGADTFTVLGFNQIATPRHTSFLPQCSARFCLTEQNCTEQRPCTRKCDVHHLFTSHASRRRIHIPTAIVNSHISRQSRVSSSLLGVQRRGSRTSKRRGKSPSRCKFGQIWSTRMNSGLAAQDVVLAATLHPHLPPTTVRGLGKPQALRQ